jgi:hypothetical protein
VNHVLETPADGYEQGVEAPPVLAEGVSPLRQQPERLPRLVF